MTAEEYKQEWLMGLHQTDYNNARFAENKQDYAINWLYKNVLNLNLNNPKNIVDRICNYKIFDKDPRKPIWCDKISVLNELHYIGLDNLIIPPIFYSRSYFTLNDYNSLPNGKYIIKCNHGSGWNIKFEKKPGFNPTYLINQIKEWYSLNYAYIGGYEWQYENIVPGIIVQPDMGPLMDWSFWCENGQIEGISLTKKLGKNLEEYIAFVDQNGKQNKWYIGMVPEQKNLLPSQQKILNEMIPYVKVLASDFKFVRVDLYYILGQVKFGELTFSPCSGRLELFQNIIS